MNNWHLPVAALLLIWLQPLQAQREQPFGGAESLRYTISYPSKLELGEARMTATRTGPGEDEPERWEFTFRLQAGMPGFKVDDQIRSVATDALCSLEFRKETSHGERSASEETTFDQDAHTAHRATLVEGAGESDIDVPECAKDGLAFLYYLRSELSSGRIPPPQEILFGAAYTVTIQPAGEQEVRIGETLYETDQMIVTVKGPASESTFVLLVGRDEARTPVRITLPLEPGNFTMELAPE